MVARMSLFREAAAAAAAAAACEEDSGQKAGEACRDSDLGGLCAGQHGEGWGGAMAWAGPCRRGRRAAPARASASGRWRLESQSTGSARASAFCRPPRARVPASFWRTVGANAAPRPSRAGGREELAAPSAAPVARRGLSPIRARSRECWRTVGRQAHRKSTGMSEKHNRSTGKCGKCFEKITGRPFAPRDCAELRRGRASQRRTRAF